MYRISWSQEENGGAVSGSQKVQYLPEIADVLRRAFGEEFAKFVVISKESND